MKRRLLLAALCVVGALGFKAHAQASYNHTYTEGATVAAGGDYFLYNIGTGQFLTSGLNYGTRATVDNSGRVLTLSANGNGYNIYTNFVSLNNRAENTRKAGYLTTNGYVDTGSSDAAWVFTPVTVSGYTNAYTIKNSDTQYLFFDAGNTDPGCPVNVGNNTENNYSYWLLIPKTTREAAGDYSHYLINTQMNACWEYKTWGGSTGWNDNATVSPGGLVSNRCGEKYHAVKDIYQEVKEAEALPEGRYKFYAQGFWRQDGSAAGPVLYANADTKTLLPLTGTENSMNDASTSFTAGNYVNSVETFVNNNSLKVGINITDGSQWVIFDNFVLDYLGQCVMDYAEELPADGNMAANTWYYFDITATADNYMATATSLADIICTTDGYTLTSATSGNITLTAEDNSFTIQRYYVKSSKANELKIGVSSYAYTVGAATPSIADNSYIGGLTTIDFSYANAQTTDPDATFAILDNTAKAVLTKGGTTVAEGALSLNGKVLTATFTNLTLDLNSDYVLSIAEEVVGYNGQETNAAINMTFHTGIIADDVYYFKKKDEYKYLTRGGNYGTETVTDNYGLSFEASIQSDGTYVMKNVDHSLSANTNKYLGEYTDANTPYYWTIETTTNGYYLKNNEGKYLTTMSYEYTDGNSNSNTYNYKSFVDTSEGAIVWNILTKEEYAASLTAKKNAEIAALATTAGITASTLNEFEAALATNYGTTDMTSSISNPLCNSATGWTAVSYNGGSKYENVDYHAPTIQIWNAVGGITQAVANLPAGLYKVTVNATWRPGNSADATRVGNEANTTAWLYANENITQLKGWYEGGGTINSTQDLIDNAASYLNTVYVYLNGSEDLKIGVAVPSFCVQNWCPIYNFTLTRFDAKATETEKQALAEAITAAETYTLGFEDGEYAPYNNVAAVQALAAAKAIDTDAASGEAVVAATNALTTATWTANTTEVNAIYGGDFTKYETVSDQDFPYGWNLYNTGNNSRIMGGTEGTSNAGLSAASSGKALLMKFNATYGESEGYTMPLKAGKTYKITFKYGGWSNTPNTIVSLTDPNNAAITLAPNFKPATSDAHSDATHWYDYEGYFVSTTAGDYKLNFNKVETGQQQIVIADIELMSAEGLAIDGTKAMPTYAPGTYSKVSVARPVSAGYNTLVLPFDVTAAEVAAKFGEDSKVYVVSVYETAKDNIKLTAQDGIEANKPVILKATTAGTSYEFTNKALGASAEAITEGNGVSMVGNYAASIYVPANDNAYVISGDKIYYVDSEVFIRNTRAYIAITNVTGNAKPRSIGFSFSDEEEATAINAVEGAKAADNDALYNLAGQRVGKDYKGIVIKNGKKVMMR